MLYLKHYKNNVTPHCGDHSCSRKETTMTIEQVVLMNGAQYIWVLGLLGFLALAWAQLEREKAN